MQVQSLGQEDPMEEGMATHSSILAYTITQIEEAGETLSFLFFIISNSHVLQGHLHEASQFSLVCSDIMLLWSHSSIVWIT